MSAQAHFLIGGAEPEYTASTAAAYKWPKSSANESRATAAKLKKGERAVVQHQRILSSMRMLTFAPPAPTLCLSLLATDLQSSHFELGADEHDWKTDTMRHFQGGQFKDGVAAENVRCKCFCLLLITEAWQTLTHLAAPRCTAVKVQTTLLRADNQDLPTHTFHEYRSSMMPDPRDTPGAYTG